MRSASRVAHFASLRTRSRAEFFSSSTGCLARNYRFRVLMSSCRGKQVGSGLTGLPDGTVFNVAARRSASRDSAARLSRVFVAYDRPHAAWN